METKTPLPKVDHRKKISAVIQKLMLYEAKIHSIAKYARDVKEDSSKIPLFRGMMHEIKGHYDKFKTLYDDLVDLHVEFDTLKDFPSEEERTLQQNCDRYYYEACGILKVLDTPPFLPVPATSAPNHDVSGSNSFSSSRILRVGGPMDNVPKFDGKLDKWPFYRDTFIAMVHGDGEIPIMEKYRILIGSLEGPALALIKGLPVLEGNYEQAWKLLTDTYNNKRILGASFLNKIIEYKPLSGSPSLATLQAFVGTVCESVESFKLLKIPNADDFILLTLVIRCLDPGTRHSFERKNLGVEIPTFDSLHEFLRGECTALTLSGGGSVSNLSSSASQHFRHRKQNISLSRPRGDSKSTLFVSDKRDSECSVSKPSQKKGAHTNSKPCPVCSAKHTLNQCERFRSSTPKERFNFLKKWNGCRVCLSSQHVSRSCTSEKLCATCNGRHHSWLHLSYDVESEVRVDPSTIKPSGDPSSRTASPMLGDSSNPDSVILGTVVGQIRDSSGQFQNIRMILDSGSQYSFITKQRVDRLGFMASECDLKISGIGQVSVANTQGVLNCCLRPATENSTILSTKAIVLDRITGNHPQIHLPANVRQKYLKFALADAQFWKPAQIEFLLGSDLFYDVLSGRPIYVGPNIPKLTPTIFGYVVGGRYQKPDQHHPSGTALFTHSSDLATVMQNFWLIEEVEPKQLKSADDEYCEQHYVRTHSRTPTGRYMVSLPFKEPPPDLTSSRHTAKLRFQNMERKLMKNPSLKNSYSQFMQEYLELKHMSVATEPAAYVIPHHGVYKVNDPNPKIRVVFDASCKTPNVSLNDYLHAGPTLQNDISVILLRFRRHEVVFTADIVKNFRQVLLNPKDRKFQHILWRSDPSEELTEYQLDTVTYGTKPAPFLSIRTLHQLVQDEGHEFPEASVSLMLDTYVDDIASGASTLEKAIDLKRQLIGLLGRGEFELSKWTSNMPQLLEDSSTEQNPLSLSLDDKLIKILGLQWDPVRDGFTYSIDAPNVNMCKRSILSSIARIFDPLGYVSPVVCYAKIILQRCWASKIDWDTPVPADVATDWKKLVSELPLMSNVFIPRHTPAMKAERIDILGFCDASQVAYGANVYLRIETSFGVETYLLKAKTKLAPLKPLTIPRLELSAALLLCKVYKSLQGYLTTLPVSQCFWFSDSTVTLGWLKSEPSKLKAWVAHRVIEVEESTNIHDWHHVQTHENPADSASRGCLPSEFINHPLWMNGPDWLCQPFSRWPIVAISKVTPSEPLPELKGNTTCLTVETSSSYFAGWMEKFSSYAKILRIMAYIVRFLKILVGWPATGSNTRKELKEKYRGSSVKEVMEDVPTIRAIEYEVAERIYIRMIQQHHFPDLVKGSVPNFRHTARLNPFVDIRGVVRVGGRLTKAPLPEGTRFPILLPKSGHFTRIFVVFHHLAYLHLGSSSLHAIIRNRYWILSGRSVIKQRVHRCAVCFKATQQPKTPFMGDLPSSRFAQGKAFINVGVDFAGPFPIRESLRRKAPVSKAWLCLFVCMASKALHLELVSSLSTPAFLATLDRFIARRGLPAKMFSDCGTNFVGASRELKLVYQWYSDEATNNAIVSHLAPQGIEWSFNPPASPNFGGLWEAGVKSAKGILRRTAGDTAFTFEELTTIFCHIEAVLNSRPLCQISDDPESLEALTPGHFLVGAPLVARPEPMLLELPENRLSRWQLVQHRAQHFWTRWRKEYLSTLQERSKWLKKKPNMEVGELVILKDRKDPPTQWTLARIVGASPGDDGILRFVEIRTASGVFSRPVSKLVSLKQVTQPEESTPSQS